jgi:hypothetical protein
MLPTARSTAPAVPLSIARIRDFSGYPKQSAIRRYCYPPLAGRTQPVVVCTPQQSQGTIALFLPEHTLGNGCNTSMCSLPFLANAMRRLDGKMICEMTPDYRILAGAVSQTALPALVQSLSHIPDSDTLPEQLTGEMFAENSGPLPSPIREHWRLQMVQAQKEAAIQQVSPRPLLLLSGDFPEDTLVDWACHIAQSLDNTREPQQPHRLSLSPGSSVPQDKTGQVYLTAAVFTPSPSLSERVALETLAVRLAEAIYEDIVTQGLAYHTGAAWQPIPKGGLLGFYVETFPEDASIVKERLTLLCNRLSATRLTESQWKRLQERAYLYTLLQRDSTLKRTFQECRNLGILAQENPDTCFLEQAREWMDSAWKSMNLEEFEAIQKKYVGFLQGKISGDSYAPSGYK